MLPHVFANIQSVAKNHRNPQTCPPLQGGPAASQHEQEKGINRLDLAPKLKVLNMSTSSRPKIDFESRTIITLPQACPRRHLYLILNFCQFHLALEAEPGVWDLGFRV